MRRRLCLLATIVLPQIAAAQKPAVRWTESGVAPGFVLDSWTVADGLPVNTISRVIQSRSGYIWLATFDGLVRFDGARFTTFNTGNSDGLASNRIVDLAESDDGSLMVTTELGHRIRFADGKFTLIRSPRAGEPAPGPPEISDAVRPDGRKWSARPGEIQLDGRPAYRVPPNAGFGMSITSIAADHEGSLWFGTTAGGLHQLKPALFSVYTISETRGHNNLYVVSPSAAGGVWAGAWAGGVSRINGDGDGFHFLSRGAPFGAGTIFEDSKRRLWVGDVLCELPRMQCIQVNSPFAGAAVYAIHETDDGSLWFGTSAGLFRFSGNAWDQLTVEQGAPRSAVRGFDRASDGALWMATNGGGLARFRDGRFTHVTTAQGLPSDLVRALYMDADGWLWAGTEGKGLARLDPREWTTPGSRGKIANVRERDGLFDDGVHSILEDGSGRLWMSTNRGIFWVRRAELSAFAEGRAERVRSTGYTERHGLLNREANGGTQPAATRSADGRMWFATQEGVAVVDPARVDSVPVRPNVLVEGLIAGGMRVAHQTEPLEIPPDRRDLLVEFTALSFTDPDNVRFRYRLHPYDRGWVNAETRRSAVYTRVPPGKYRFEVEATNGGGVWTRSSNSLQLSVVPRFFETRTFAFLVVLALALATWAAVRWRIARLRTVAAELQQKVDARTRELREREALLADQNARLGEQADQLQQLDRAKTRFFANVSHELRTPLTLTIGPLEDLRAQLSDRVRDPDTRDSLSRLDMALRNARRLFRLVNQILDVSKLEAGGTRLRARRGDLVAFVRGIAAAFDSVAERKRINFQVNAPETVETWFDPDALEKVVANLLSNAFKFVPPGGGILVSVVKTEDHARVQVFDSGPGIPPMHLPHIFDRFYQVDETNTRAQPGTGIGLSLARELAELHAGTLEVESGPGGGATFTLSLPLGRAHLTDDQVVDEPAAVRQTSFDGIMTDLEPASVPRESADGNGVDAGESDDVPMLLVVDDNADLREYVRARFESRYRIVEAEDGADALRRARELIPDLVISDVMMPGTDGHVFCAALRESPETDFIPVILLTAQAEVEQRVAGLGRGADDYIVKPFDMRELEARVENLIASRRRLRERYSAGGLKVTTSGDHMSSGDRAFVERLTAAIEANLSNPDFGVIELASAVFQDRSHLFRRTREVLGETPSDLLRRLRLERAAGLLSDERATVAEVAYGAGFNSVSHFCRVFRGAYGVTPSAYRDSRNTAHT